MIFTLLRKGCSFVLRAVRVYLYNKRYQTKIYSVKANLTAKYGRSVLIGSGSIIDENVSIGDYSYVNINSSVENAVIGKYCSISSGVYINPYEHNWRLITTHPIIKTIPNKSEKMREKVCIGHDVLISLNVIITSGVNIGNGAVIGAGAVVTKDVKDYEIVGGVPARHIGWRFDEEKRKYLSSLEWWNWSDEKIKANILWLRGETQDIVG